MTTQKPLAELFRFKPKTPILGNLNNVLRALDIRLNALDDIGEEQRGIVDTITAIALARMNETFTPLIIAAQQRLEQFGAAFSAESGSSLLVGTGAKILVLTEETREGWIIADYVGLTASDESGATMLAKVDDYDRETGQLFVTAIGTGGSGTHAGWIVRMSAAPDLAHAGRTDNPHSVTAAQVGTYTSAAIDELVAEIFADAKSYVDGLGFMRQSSNLADLINKPQALANLGGQAALTYTPLNKAGDTSTGQQSAPSFRALSGTYYLSPDGSKYIQWSGVAVTTNVGTVMHRQENLAGLSNPAAARSNLGLGSAATVNTSAFAPAPPPGLVNSVSPAALAYLGSIYAVDSMAGPEPGHHIQLYWETGRVRVLVDGSYQGAIKLE